MDLDPLPLVSEELSRRGWAILHRPFHAAELEYQNQIRPPRGSYSAQGTERYIPIEWIYEGNTKCFSRDELKDVSEKRAIVAVCAPDKLFTSCRQSFRPSLKGVDVGRVGIDKHVMAKGFVLGQPKYR